MWYIVLVPNGSDLFVREKQSGLRDAKSQICGGIIISVSSAGAITLYRRFCLHFLVHEALTSRLQ
jgi:hypothetical protein